MATRFMSNRASRLLVNKISKWPSSSSSVAPDLVITPAFGYHSPIAIPAPRSSSQSHLGELGIVGRLLVVDDAMHSSLHVEMSFQLESLDYIKVICGHEQPY